MTDVSFGISVPVSGRMARVPLMVQTVQQAEALGYDFFNVREHINWGPYNWAHEPTTPVYVTEGGGDPTIHEALVTLAFLAAKTERMRFLPTVMVPAPRHAVILAKQLATLDALSGGRLIVGLGAGAESRKFEFFETPFEHRGALLDEYIEAMKEIWTKPPASYQGKYIKFSHAEIFPQPVQDPLPIWLGGNSPAMLRRVGRVGDGWVGASLTLDRFRDCVQRIRQNARKYGRPDARVRIHYHGPVIFGRTADEARAEAARRLEVMIPAVPGWERDRTLDEVIGSAFIGTAEEVREQVRARIEAGATSIGFNTWFPDLDGHLENMELVMNDVIRKL